MTHPPTPGSFVSTVESSTRFIDLSATGNVIPGLALALAAGMMIGVERGWRLRAEEPGSRVAGVRTFSLLGLFGGLAGLDLGRQLTSVFLILVAAAMAIILLGYRAVMRHKGNLSATSAVAAVLTLALGAISGAGHLAIAAIGTGVAVILLASRETLHSVLEGTTETELRALVRLVLLVFVILPLLPDAAFGPYGLNPRRVWTVVVITGAVSFFGYVLMRILGGRRGMMVTAVVGALVSSTAVTLECARRMRANESIRTNRAAIAVASTIMMLRASFLVAVLTPFIFGRFLGLIVPALIVSAAASAALIYRASSEEGEFATEAIKPPDIKIALMWGGLVLLMAVAAGWAERQVQGSGAAVVAVGGLFDVDSAIAAIGTLPAGTLSPRLASFAVAAPVIFNSLLKAGLALAVAGIRHALQPAAALAIPAAVIAGAILVSAL